jgi:hypothetical protein
VKGDVLFMDENQINDMEKEFRDTGSKTSEVTYSHEKDFYKGIGGELRFKAEGLFKKAKEKGISIEDINVQTLREASAEFPGIGEVGLPAFIVKVTGRDILSGQVIVDGKQIDYYNRYQKYIADKVENKNVLKDEMGRKVRENSALNISDIKELNLTERERFNIGKSLIEDKEFGLEKTITGACDRVIRKLMGENDWLYPDEARLLDEELDEVQKRAIFEGKAKRSSAAVTEKKATDRQINYFKAKVKNSGMDPEDNTIIMEVLRQAGYDKRSIDDLSTSDMSKLIDKVSEVMPRVSDMVNKGKILSSSVQKDFRQPEENLKQ